MYSSGAGSHDKRSSPSGFQVAFTKRPLSSQIDKNAHGSSEFQVGQAGGRDSRGGGVGSDGVESVCGGRG